MAITDTDRTRWRTGWLLLILGLILPATPHAQEDNACLRDIQQFCAQAGAWPQRFHCLAENKQRLTPACREKIEQKHSAGRLFMEDCREDIVAHCPQLEGHRLMECLQDSRVQISLPCIRRIEELQRVRRIDKERIAAACKADTETLCQSTLPVSGQSNIKRCLKSHEGRLQPQCREALSREQEPPSSSNP